MEKVTEDAIKAARLILGLDKPDNSAELQKAEDEKKAADLKKAEDDKAAAAAIEKAEKEKAETELAETLKKAEELQIKLGLKKAEETPITATVSSGSTITLTPVDNSKELVKAFDEKFNALATMTAKKDEEIAELKKGISDISEFNARLAEQIGMIAKQPLDRKSLSGATYIERFEKGGEGKEKGEFKTLNISNALQKAELTDIMFNALQKSEMKDVQLEKAIKCIEGGNILSDNPTEAQRIYNRMKSEFKVVVVK